MTFAELVSAVAGATGQPKAATAQSLRTFVEVLKEALNSGEEVKLTGFGVFYVVTIPSRQLWGTKRASCPSHLVRFRELRKRRKNMEKLAVVIDDEKVKTAGVQETCPLCSKPLVLDGPFPACPVHGTEPFEKRPKK